MRQINTAVAFEDFTDSKSNNWQIIESLSTIKELKKLLNTLPYFEETGEVTDYGWVAFPIDAATYVLAIFQFDDSTGEIKLSHFDTHTVNEYPSAVDAVEGEMLFHSSKLGPTSWSVPTIREAVLSVNPEYKGKSDDELVGIFNKDQSKYFTEALFEPFLDDYMQPFFDTLKQKVKPYYATVTKSSNGDTVSSARDAISYMMKQGGEVSYNGLTGLPVYVSYDYTANKLRAKTNDGHHGVAFVAFPNSARFNDALYLVPLLQVTWTGKNYRISNSVPLDKYRVQ